MPVEHRANGSYTIQKSTYPQGLMLIPTGSDPTAIPAVLPALVTGATSVNVTLDSDDVMDYGFGVTIVFI